MTDHSYPHRLPLSLRPLLALLAAQLRARVAVRRAKRQQRLNDREISALSDHMLKDIGYFHD